MRKCMTCGAPFEASPKEHTCESCHDFFERIKEIDCPLRTELVRLMNSQEIAPPITPQPHAAEALKVKIKGDMPEVNPRRLYDDEKPDGYLESTDDWVSNNIEAIKWFEENHGAIKNLLSKIARLEAAGDAIVACLEHREMVVPPCLLANWQSAKQ